MLDRIPDDVKTFLLKIILPALVAVSIKLAIQSQRTKMSVFNIMGSFVVGVGIAYLTGGLILSSVSAEYVPLIIGVVTLTGEKIAYWILYSLKVDKFALSLMEYLIGLMKK
jgi:hypothetical protein